MPLHVVCVCARASAHVFFACVCGRAAGSVPAFLFCCRPGWWLLVLLAYLLRVLTR